jgi:hypothetical protein
MTNGAVVRLLALSTIVTGLLADVAYAGAPTPVPEPGTTLLLLGGLGAAAWWWRRRSK